VWFKSDVRTELT